MARARRVAIKTPASPCEPVPLTNRLGSWLVSKLMATDIGTGSYTIFAQSGCRYVGLPIDRCRGSNLAILDLPPAAGQAVGGSNQALVVLFIWRGSATRKIAHSVGLHADSIGLNKASYIDNLSMTLA